jgi:preprotein translocase subunit SecD
VAAATALVVVLGACSGGGGDDAGAEPGGTGDAAPLADGSGGTAPTPTQGGDGVAAMLRTVSVPCPAELVYVASQAGESCYQLGESGGLGTDAIESATVELAGGYWEVQLVMTDSGLARFNALATACIDETPTCPSGRVAFVADRSVVSTATITKPSYERDEVMITGRFNADQARIIANALSR